MHAQNIFAQRTLLVLQGIKLELFIFDTFPMASKVTLMEVLANPRLDLVNSRVE